MLYATSSANSVAQKSNRKTITGPDVVRFLFLRVLQLEMKYIRIKNISKLEF